MKLCVAQTKPVKGDISRNIINHKKFIELAVFQNADMIIFPELSLTGYEPTLAKELAIHPDDERLDGFQIISNKNQITIGVGVPTKAVDGINISMIIFQPHFPRQVYSKTYLHLDEEPYFVSGQGITSIIVKENNIAFAICYELSIPEHAENASRNGAHVYIASVAKSDAGVKEASEMLSKLAAKYSMPVLMSNCIGLSDNFQSAGASSVWCEDGTLQHKLDSQSEGILIFDTVTQKSAAVTLE
jgi:predicted amidohydrolase